MFSRRECRGKGLRAKTDEGSGVSAETTHTMRKALRILGRVVLVLVLLIAVAVTTLYFLAQRRLNKSWQVTVPSITVPTDADAVARGKKLVTVYVPCGDCHGADFGGKVMIDGAAMGRLWASNLTRGRGGIAATYTDADWVRTLLHGVKPDGHTVVFMPSHEFHLTEADTADVIAFFRAAPPVDRERPATRIGPMAARPVATWGCRSSPPS